MSNEQQSKIQWKNIFMDMLILMIIVGIFGAICKVGMGFFERSSPFDNLVSIVAKDKMAEDGTNPDFENEFKRSIEKDPKFINVRDANQLTSLMWFNYVNLNDYSKLAEMDSKRLYYVKRLLSDPEIDVQAKDKDGFTALHWAAWSGLTQCCDILLQQGLDINQAENNGYTPLMLAASRGNEDTVKFLLEKGADATLKNYKGEDAKALAIEKFNSYKSSDSFFYSMIYSEARDQAHEDTVKLFAN